MDRCQDYNNSPCCAELLEPPVELKLSDGMVLVATVVPFKDENIEVRDTNCLEHVRQVRSREINFPAVFTCERVSASQYHSRRSVAEESNFASLS